MITGPVVFTLAKLKLLIDENFDIFSFKCVSKPYPVLSYFWFKILHSGL